jgi:nucleoid DNA-binding protein
MGKDVETISIQEIITKLVDAPLSTAECPTSYREMIKSKKELVDKVFDSIVSEVAQGKRVRIKNIGTFSCRLTKPQARNPSSNETVVVTNRNRLKFEPSTRTVIALNKSK